MSEADARPEDPARPGDAARPEDPARPGDPAQSEAPAQPGDPAPEATTPLEPPTAAPASPLEGALGGSLGRTVRAGLGGESLSGRGVLDAIGGWRGIAETLVPGLLFLIIFTFTRDARISAIAPAALALGAIAVRLIRREPLASVFSGAIGVGIAVAATMLTGRGEDYYLPGFITNIVWAAGLLISVLIGWPLLGIALGAFRGSLTAWRREKPLRRAATWLTLVWCGLFIARLAVQVPLYLAAKDGGDPSATDALGIARLVMGVPLFALVVVFTWMVLNRLAPSSDDPDPDSVASTGENTP